MIAVALGAVITSFTVLLAIGGLTGRVRVTSCCSIADPSKDARMESAFRNSTTSRPELGSSDWPGRPEGGKSDPA